MVVAAAAAVDVSSVDVARVDVVASVDVVDGIDDDGRRRVFMTTRIPSSSFPPSFLTIG